MQFYANSNRQAVKTGFIFVAAMFIAYLPVSSFLFFLKNDAFTGYFPPKYFMSESLQAGYLPLWNPYINYGIPQYGDMSSAFWNPITWLVAGTTGYNAYTFTLELMFYLVLGGLGMYVLLKHWQVATPIRLMAGLCYLCCGYQVGHLQHFNWVSGAALLPWCLWSYLLLIKKSCIRHVILAALLFYLLVSAAHPGISIGALYFFAALSLFCLCSAAGKLQFALNVKKYVSRHLLLILAFTALSLGMLLGYADVLPHMTRGEKISLQDAMTAPTNFKSWVSVLLPLAVVKNHSWFATDVSMRNCYIGLLPLIFLLACLLGKKTGWQKFLLVAGGFFMLLASGGVFKTLAYYGLPLIGFVRLNGEFTIFSLFCFIVVGAIQMQQYKTVAQNSSNTLSWICRALQWILGTAFVGGLLGAFITADSIVFRLQSIAAASGMAGKLKSLIDQLSFWDTLWIQSAIQSFFLTQIKKQLLNHNYKLLLRLCAAELVLATLMNVPFTGAGKASVAQIQSIINRAPKGIPIPVMQPILQHPVLDTAATSMIGHWGFYNKQIGVVDEALYPIVLSITADYFNGKQLNNYFNRPPFFTTDSSHFKIINFSPHSAQLSVNAASPGLLVYQQAFYPHWFVVANNGKEPITSFNNCFMAAPIQKGQQQVQFLFDPFWPKFGLYFSLAVLIIYLALLFWKGFKVSYQ